MCAGADVNATGYTAGKASGGGGSQATPLIRAAEFGHLDTLLALLEHGADAAAERAAEGGGGGATVGRCSLTPA